jgi:hypothetical protein
VPQRDLPVVLHIGNAAVLEQHKPDPKTDLLVARERPDLGHSVTALHLPPAYAKALAAGQPSFKERMAHPGPYGHPYDAAMFDLITAWGLLSADAPTWVTASHDGVAEAASALFEAERPKKKDRDHAHGLGVILADEPEHDTALRAAQLHLDADPGQLARSLGIPRAALADVVDLDALCMGDRDPRSSRMQKLREAAILTMLKTNAGIDLIFNASFGTAAQPAAITWVGLTANAVAPAATDTTLAGEIATAGGGLIRAQVVFSHTAGTATATLVKTYTGNASDAYPVTIAKIGGFNASSAGTMGLETLLTTVAPINQSGDFVQITDTLTQT